MQKIIIDSSNENQRLDKFLKRYFTQAKSSFIYKMLRKKNITLNGHKDSGNTIIKADDVIEVFFSDKTFAIMQGEDVSSSEYESLRNVRGNVDILYEDDDILAVNKPKGMLSQKRNKNDISINEHIISYLINEKKYSLKDYRTFHPSISNRLDTNTTGVILAAKTLKGQQNLSYALKHRKIDKYYIALVYGLIDEHKTLKNKLNKDKNNNIAYIKKSNNTNIVTDINPIIYNDHLTLLKIHLITGKTHQIRAHMAYIGHPIIGDMKYGIKRYNDYYKEKYNVTSQMLHSYQTYYDDIIITAPLPDIMKRIIKEEYGDVELQRS